MSLRTVGYTSEGRAIRIDDGPSYARIPGVRGHLVESGPGPYDAERQAAHQRKYKARLTAKAAGDVG